MKKPELLLPGGSLDILKTAVRYGADAVYIGGEAFGLRAKATNFTPSEMREGISFAHAHGVKVHVTANIFAHNRDLVPAEAYFEELAEMQPDAILIADPGMFALARRKCPGIALHISTQANTTNYESCRFWYEQGAKRIVTARELTLAEIRELRDRLPEDLELECFVHGAMCISYSGRCLLSNYMAGRDANAGACSHPCRWQYALMEETRPGEYMPVYENERGTFIMNSKDLCMLEYMPELYASGVDSFKIEGRMKNALYVACAARTYKKAMKTYEEDPARYEAEKALYMQEISACTYRPFTTGFCFGKPGEDAQTYDNNTYENAAVFMGVVREIAPDGSAVWEQKNKFSRGDVLEIMKSDGRNLAAEVLSIVGENGEERESAPHPLERIRVKMTEAAEVGDVIRKKT